MTRLRGEAAQSPSICLKAGAMETKIVRRHHQSSSWHQAFSKIQTLIWVGMTLSQMWQAPEQLRWSSAPNQPKICYQNPLLTSSCSRKQAALLSIRLSLWRIAVKMVTINIAGTNLNLLSVTSKLSPSKSLCKSSKTAILRVTPRMEWLKSLKNWCTAHWRNAIRCKMRQKRFTSIRAKYTSQTKIVEVRDRGPKMITCISMPQATLRVMMTTRRRRRAAVPALVLSQANLSNFLP